MVTYVSLSSQIASTATNPNPTVSVHVITDQIFALSLPLKNGKEMTKSPSTLSLGEKIGIGVGAGVVCLALVGLGAFFLFRRRIGKKAQYTPSPPPPPFEEAKYDDATPGSETSGVHELYQAAPKYEMPGGTTVQELAGHGRYEPWKGDWNERQELP